MIRKIIFHDVLEWIEENLYINPDINLIAKISGYSKSHIQNIFKNNTGVSVGHYVKERRLSQAALLIRLTKKSIFNIAMDLNYSSQQTFHRAFLNKFGYTPLSFRKLSYFDVSKLEPKFNADHFSYNIKVKDNIYFSLEASPIEYYENILSERYKKANDIKLKHILDNIEKSDSVYFASTYSILPSLKNEVKVTSYIGTWQEPEANLTIPKGKYAYIEFSGTWNEYIFFSRHLYLLSEFKRRDGYDVEIFSLNPNKHGQYNVKIYIPII